MSTETVTLFFGLLTWVALVAIVGTVLAVVVAHFSRGAAEALENWRRTMGPAAVVLALSVALVATLGSLYLSEVAHFVPCKLCWYQRIAMYPIVPVLTVALLRAETSGRWYAVTLAAIGSLISTYHVAVQRFPSLESGTCTPDAPCTAIWVEEFGFMTIPFMALAAFLLVLTMLLAWVETRKE